jgi:hypothetical protein
MKEFFGWGGYTRPAEGFMSWQHLLFVSLLMALMFAGAVYFGRKYRHAQDAQKNRVLAISAILVDAVELFKIVIICLRSGDAWGWRYELPLFMCSILLIAMPVAAFSKGRLREAALDFVLIFGLLGAVLGTYGAGNNYSTYPVLSFDNLVSGITHALSGFASLYIGIAGMTCTGRAPEPIAAPDPAPSPLNVRASMSPLCIVTLAYCPAPLFPPAPEPIAALYCPSALITPL